MNRLVIHASKNAHWQIFCAGLCRKKPIIGEQSSCDVVKTCILLILFFRLVSRLFCFYGWFLSKAERIAKIVWMILILKIHALTHKLIVFESSQNFKAKQTNNWDRQTPRLLFGTLLLALLLYSVFVGFFFCLFVFFLFCADQISRERKNISCAKYHCCLWMATQPAMLWTALAT